MMSPADAPADDIYGDVAVPFFQVTWPQPTALLAAIAFCLGSTASAQINPPGNGNGNLGGISIDADGVVTRVQPRRQNSRLQQEQMEAQTKHLEELERARDEYEKKRKEEKRRFEKERDEMSRRIDDLESKEANYLKEKEKNEGLMK